MIIFLYIYIYCDEVTGCSRRGRRRNHAAVNCPWERRLGRRCQRELAQDGHTPTHTHANHWVRRGRAELSARERSHERGGRGREEESSRSSSHAGNGATRRSGRARSVQSRSDSRLTSRTARLARERVRAGGEEEGESKPSAAWTRRRESGRALEPAERRLRRRIRDAIDRNGIWKASRFSALAKIKR